MPSKLKISVIAVMLMTFVGGPAIGAYLHVYDTGHGRVEKLYADRFVYKYPASHKPSK